MNGEKFVEIVRRGSIENVRDELNQNGIQYINFQDKSTLRSALHYAAGLKILRMRN
jgi:hypothetical protein